MALTQDRELQDRLDEVMNNAAQPRVVVEGTERRWMIEDPGAAEWALRKRAKIADEITQVRELVAREIAVLQDFEEAELARLLPQVENFDGLLAEWHRKVLSDDAEAKTLHYPHGTLKARKAPDGVEIADEVALLDWALEHDQRFVRVKESLDKQALKDAVLKSGEVIPGVAPVTGEIRYSVAPNEVEL